MAFSFDWFLTVPGILISLGVILLIIALILFVVSSMKEKKGEVAPSILEDNGMMNSEQSNIGMNNTSVNPTEMNNFGMDSTTVNPAEVNNFGMNSTTANPAEVNNFDMNSTTANPAEMNNFGMNSNVVMDQPQNNPAPEMPPVVDIPPFVESNNAINNEPINVDIPVVETPLISTVSDEIIVPSFEGDSIIPTVQESGNNMADNNSFVLADLGDMIVPTEPVVNNENVSSVEPANNSSLFEIPEPVVEVEHRPIYGGADPLEATQTLPRMDVHHEPYSGGTVEVIPTPIEETIVQPINQFNEQPVQPEIVSDIPVQSMVNTNTVNNVVDNTPSIVSIPDDIEEL